MHMRVHQMTAVGQGLPPRKASHCLLFTAHLPQRKLGPVWLRSLRCQLQPRTPATGDKRRAGRSPQQGIAARLPPSSGSQACFLLRESAAVPASSRNKGHDSGGSTSPVCSSPRQQRRASSPHAQLNPLLSPGRPPHTTCLSPRILRQSASREARPR